MKKSLSILLALALCLSLCACGGGSGSGSGSGQTSGGTKTKNVEHVSMEVVYNNAQAKEKGVITAFYEDGTEAWSNETDEAYISELDSVQEIGWFGSNYLFVFDGAVYCLDPQDGSLEWFNDEFEGAGASWCFDDDYNLYICGCYGPDLMVIDPSGNTLYRYEDLSDNMPDYLARDLFWPTAVEVEEYEGDMYAMIHFEGAQLAYVLVETGEVEDVLIDSKPVTLDILEGSWADSVYAPTVILNIYDDGSYQLFRNDDYYNYQYEYEGRLILSSFYDDGITDWIRTDIEYTDDYNFENVGGIGDYLFVGSYEDETGEVQEIYLYQVNNGDSVMSYYFDNTMPVFVRIHPEG